MLFLFTRFTQQILFRLPQVFGDFKMKCLEMLLSRAEHIDDLFLELKSKNFTTLLEHRSVLFVSLLFFKMIRLHCSLLWLL